MKFVNLTPHAVVVRLKTYDRVFPPSGTVARVTRKNIQDYAVDGIPLSLVSYGDVEGLPPADHEQPLPEGAGPYDSDTVYIVSGVVAQAVGGRSDVVAPDTGPTACRNAAGQIEAVRGFVRY